MRQRSLRTPLYWSLLAVLAALPAAHGEGKRIAELKQEAERLAALGRRALEVADSEL